MDKQQIANDFEKTFSNLEQAITGFDYDNYNKVPFVGSWTPGQVVEHIILAADGFSKALNGKVADAERAPDQLVEMLKNILMNFDSKMDSPDFILPALKDYDKQSQASKVLEIKEKVVNDISALDLTKICLDMELPKLGNVSRFEAISFVIFHTRRHTHQLEKIARFLKLS